MCLSDRRLTYVTFLWGLTSFVEQLAFYNWFPTWEGQLDAAAALLALCRPSWTFSLVLLVVANCLILGTWMPADILGNHNVFEFLINVNMAVVLAYHWIKRPKAGNRRAAIYESLAPLLRIYLVGIYLVVFWAKLNPDFLDPRYSCGAVLFKHISGAYPAFNWFWHMPVMEWFPIWGTLLLEGGLPVLFMFRKTRPLALLAGIVFHFFLGLEPVEEIYTFSVMMLFMYFVFIPDEAFNKLSVWVKCMGAYLHSMVPHALVRYLPVLVLVYLPQYLNAFYHHDYMYWLRLWFFIYVPLAGLYIWALATAGALPERDVLRGDFLPKPAGFLILTGLFLFNYLAPYTGLKTQGSMTMYSNLRILGGKPNHFLMPASWIIFKQPMVKILDSDCQAFSKFANTPFLLPQFEVRRISNWFKGSFYITCIYQGRTLTIFKSAGDSNYPLFKPLPPLQAALLHFKPEDEREHNCYCTW